MIVYVAMIDDTHCETEPYVFTTAQAAVDFARDQAQQGALSPEDVDEREVGGWVYFAQYSPDSRVWVLERTVEDYAPATPKGPGGRP